MKPESTPGVGTTIDWAGASGVRGADVCANAVAADNERQQQKTYNQDLVMGPRVSNNFDQFSHRNGCRSYLLPLCPLPLPPCSPTRPLVGGSTNTRRGARSEEHTSELHSRENIV